ncbi:MAG: nucleotidyltransferase family protein [Bacillota bacterium]
MADVSVGAVVPAAGLSTRMGYPKPCLPWGSSTVLSHVVGALREGGANPIVVVLGYQWQWVLEQHAALAASPGVVFQFNPAFATGEMLSSVKAGLLALNPREHSAFLLCPADMPMVSPAVVRALLQAHLESPGKIIVPTYAGKKGHPALFPMELYGEIMGLPSTPYGLKLLGTRHPSLLQTLDLECEGVTLDLDTPGDYQRLKPQSG